MSKIIGIPIQVPKSMRVYNVKSLKVQAKITNKKSMVAAKQYTKAAKQYFNRIIK